MPLINIEKPKKEPEYVFTNYEQLALQLLPPEQVRASNHDAAIIDLMMEAESRDASFDHTRNDVYKAFETGDFVRVLAASKNLTPAEKDKIVQGLYNHLLSKVAEPELDAYGKPKGKKEMGPKDVKRLALLLEDPKIDLFHFCVKLGK